MDIESILLSKNRDAFNRIVTMMRSLIVKNDAEAEFNETTETAAAYDAYQYAFEGNDSIMDYNVSMSELLSSGFTQIEASELIAYPTKMRSLQVNKDARIVSLLTKLRSNRVSSYVENNVYYRPFCGLPTSEKEYIYVINNDKHEDSDPDTIFLHQVNYSDYPKTYNRLFYERDIDAIYKKYDYQYLIFIENKITPYEIRHKEQFEICYYDKSALNANEYDCFFEAYNTARTEILRNDYIPAFETTYSAYSNTMFMFILYYTFNLYCANSLERYAVRDYTDDEIYDIIDSKGLSKLKDLDMAVLKRVVKYFPDIQANIGTNNIIDVIFDIVADKTLTVKRYYLTKKYNIDSQGNTIIAEEKGMYSDQVDLVFQEKTIKQGENATFTANEEHNYLDIVMQDDTWGATHGVTDVNLKMQIKNEMREELLKANFSSIMTKYIGISKIVDMYVKTVDANDKLGLLYQANEYKGNFLKDDTVVFNGIETHVLSIYAAWCLMYGTLNGMTDPDYIIKDMSTIEGVMKLRKASEIQNDVEDLSNVVIDLGNGYNKVLGDYLTNEEIRTYLVNFNYDASTPIEQIVQQYDDNYAIISAITKKLSSKSNYDEYAVWETILAANKTAVNINSLFGSASTYSGYIRQNDQEFYKYLESVSINTEREAILNIIESLKDTFVQYIYTKSDGTISMMVDESDASDKESLNTISILLNQFMSCYNQLLTQDFHVGYDDPGENSLVLLYTKLVEAVCTSETEALDLVQTILHDIHIDFVDDDYLELIHNIIDTVKIGNEENLVLEYEYLRTIFSDLFRDHIELVYGIVKDHFKYNLDNNLILEHEMKFKEL